MKFDGCKRVVTTEAVWNVIADAHKDGLKTFVSPSAPFGDPWGGRESGMETAYGFDGATCPTMAARSTWEVKGDGAAKREILKYEYWLYFPIKDDDE